VKPRAVCITPDAADAALALEARRVLPHAAFTVTEDDPLHVYPELPPWQIVLLNRFHGELVRPINETERSVDGRSEAYLGCGANCPGRCAYCVLQECISVPYPTVHANVEDMLSQLEERLAAEPDLYLHLGHVLDPLAYPFLGPLLGGLIARARRFPRACLELRTKFTAVDLLPAGPPANVVLAFSFAPHRIITIYEPGTSSLGARLRAARNAARRGYRVGLRLDPVLLYPGWERAYAALCARLLSELPHAAVADVVIGCFRGPPALVDRVRGSDPSDVFRSGEFVRIGEGKAGYPRPHRIHALRILAARLGGRFPLRVCFEDDDVVDAVFARQVR
jgi:spore photoproduct lyase